MWGHNEIGVIPAKDPVKLGPSLSLGLALFTLPIVSLTRSASPSASDRAEMSSSSCRKFRLGYTRTRGRGTTHMARVTIPAVCRNRALSTATATLKCTVKSSVMYAPTASPPGVRRGCAPPSGSDSQPGFALASCFTKDRLVLAKHQGRSPVSKKALLRRG